MPLLPPFYPHTTSNFTSISFFIPSINTVFYLIERIIQYFILLNDCDKEQCVEANRSLALATSYTTSFSIVLNYALPLITDATNKCDETPLGIAELRDYKYIVDYLKTRQESFPGQPGKL